MNPFSSTSGLLSGRSRPVYRLARGLGWVSIGIGLTEILAPGKVQRLLGLEDEGSQRGLLRMLGLREIGHGVAILSRKQLRPDLTASVMSRIAGDLLDGALLGLAATRTRHPGRFALTATMVMGVVVADLLCAGWLQKRRRTRLGR